jgi:hypothetical protein
LLLFQNVAGNCNVCKNSRQILNPSYSFDMVDKATNTRYIWICGYLAEAVGNVNAINGAVGEAFYCVLGQLWVDIECKCSGNPAPLQNEYHPYPFCNLCGLIDGIQREQNYVPETLKKELVDTGVVGNMPCGGLYYALLECVFPSNLCPTVQQNAGNFLLFHTVIRFSSCCISSCISSC